MVFVFRRLCHLLILMYSTLEKLVRTLWVNRKDYRRYDILWTSDVISQLINVCGQLDINPISIPVLHLYYPMRNLFRQARILHRVRLGWRSIVWGPAWSIKTELPYTQIGTFSQRDTWLVCKGSERAAHIIDSCSTATRWNEWSAWARWDYNEVAIVSECSDIYFRHWQ